MEKVKLKKMVKSKLFNGIWGNKLEKDEKYKYSINYIFINIVFTKNKFIYN